MHFTGQSGLPPALRSKSLFVPLGSTTVEERVFASLPAVAVLARRGLRWLLRRRTPQCGARRHMCCLGRRLIGRRRACSTRAALASTLADATVWREAAHVLPRAAAAWPSLCSLYAGCAGFYAGGRHGVARGGTCAASVGGGLAVAVLALCGLRWFHGWRSPQCDARRRVCCLE